MTGNKLGFVATALLTIAVALACSGICFGAETYPVAYERDVKVVDARRRRTARRHLPAAGGGEVSGAAAADALRQDGALLLGCKAAARGYVVIIQDVRGRYASEGEWYTFKNETNDGYDTVEWAAALPYSNGKVGMFGGSYVGATQMLAAITHPPHLAGICPVVTASNYHANWTYQGGAFEQWFNESWTSGLAQDTLNREGEGRDQRGGGDVGAAAGEVSAVQLARDARDRY